MKRHNLVLPSCALLVLGMLAGVSTTACKDDADQAVQTCTDAFLEALEFDPCPLGTAPMMRATAEEEGLEILAAGQGHVQTGGGNVAIEVPGSAGACEVVCRPTAACLNNPDQTVCLTDQCVTCCGEYGVKSCDPGSEGGGGTTGNLDGFVPASCECYGPATDVADDGSDGGVPPGADDTGDATTGDEAADETGGLSTTGADDTFTSGATTSGDAGLTSGFAESGSGVSLDETGA